MKEIVSQLFDEKKNVDSFAEMFVKYRQSDSRDPNYNVKRIVKAMKSVRTFISDKYSKVLLVMTNRNVVEYSDYNIFSEGVIGAVISALCEEKGVADKNPNRNSIFRRILRLIHCSFRGLYLYTNPRKRRDLNVIYA